MFFEDDDKDLSKNMDDYDLDFDEDKSIGWDKLLDEADAAEQEQESDTPADDLLLVDDQTFDDLLSDRSLNVDENEQLPQEENFSDSDSLGNFDVDFEVENQEDDNAVSIADSDDIMDVNPAYVQPQQIAQSQIEPEPIPDAVSYQQPYIQPQVQPQAQQAVPLQQEIYPQQAYQPQAEQSYGEPVLNNGYADEAAKQGQQGADDDINYDADYSKKPSSGQVKNQSILWGMIAACAVIAVGFLVFNIFGKNLVSPSVSNGDANELADNTQVEFTQEDPFGDGSEQQAPDAFGTDQPSPPDVPNASAGNAGANTDAVAQNAPKPQVNIPPQQGVQPKPVASASKPVTEGAVKQGAGAANAKTVDTKKVINIVNTGRSNPFVPAANFNNLGFFSNPKMDVLEPPTELGNLVEDVEKLIKITVSGILYDSVKPSAIVTIDDVDYFVQKGDRVDSYIVTAITQNSVVIKDGTNIYQASIGQSFSKDSIKGQISGVSSKRTGRQYVTADQIDVNKRDYQNSPQPYATRR